MGQTYMDILRFLAHKTSSNHAKGFVLLIKFMFFLLHVVFYEIIFHQIVIIGNYFIDVAHHRTQSLFKTQTFTGPFDSFEFWSPDPFKFISLFISNFLRLWETAFWKQHRCGQFEWCSYRSDIVLLEVTVDLFTTI